MMAGRVDMKALREFERRLGYRFRDQRLLIKALSHASYTNEHGLPKTESNERLEFLGDSIVDMVVSEYLYRRYTELPEGALTKLRAAVVCEASFAKIAARMGFGECILLGRGEDATGGRKRASVLANAFEAVVAAMYLDGGMDQAYRWIVKHLEPYIRLAVAGKAVKDYKTMLQELVQKGDRGKVSYQVAKEQGPDHAKVFTVEVFIDGVRMAEGKGSSKKDAEQSAASAAIGKIAKKKKEK